MSQAFDTDTRRAIRSAIARDLYDRDAVSFVDPQLAGAGWLVATHRGLYAVSIEGARLVSHGWFFGIHRDGNTIYLFENCAMRARQLPMGRIIRFEMEKGLLTKATIFAKGLHANCHQLRVIDDLLCLVDTANQRILRYATDGNLVDSIMPFPCAPPSDRSGAYLHINSIAKVGDGIGMILHNGPVVPEKKSELALFDNDWRLCQRRDLEGHHCHDIAEDDKGTLWHCASRSGEVISSTGQRIPVSRQMTRGLAITPHHIAVGSSPFGPRQVRDGLPGEIIIYDRAFRQLAAYPLAGPPADILAI